MVFALGFLSGFLANWGFGVISRMLPAKLVRYKIRLGAPIRFDTRKQDWFFPVYIEPPTWKRALMEPMREYLTATLQLDNEGPKSGVWNEGDINFHQILADGARQASVVLFTDLGMRIILSDSTDTVIDEREHSILVTILRSVDQQIAASAQRRFSLHGQQIDFLST